MLNNFSKSSDKKSKRVGRGYGSKKGGHTSGRGSKGQKSRSGYSSPRPGFEGGRMPLSRRIPKLKGFDRAHFKVKTKLLLISLDELNVFNDDEVVNIESLFMYDIVRPSSMPMQIKILSKGTLNKKISVQGINVSKSVKDAIASKGGKVLMY
jgi:large subunit ribosomal protein L15